MKTPFQAAVVAYVKSASKMRPTLSNEDFYQLVMKDFGVTFGSAKSLLMMASFGRSEDWKPER